MSARFQLIVSFSEVAFYICAHKINFQKIIIGWVTVRDTHVWYSFINYKSPQNSPHKIVPKSVNSGNTEWPFRRKLMGAPGWGVMLLCSRHKSAHLEMRLRHYLYFRQDLSKHFHHTSLFDKEIQVIARSQVEEHLEGRFGKFVPFYTEGSDDPNYGPATTACYTPAFGFNWAERRNSHPLSTTAELCAIWVALQMLQQPIPAKGGIGFGKRNWEHVCAAARLSGPSLIPKRLQYLRAFYYCIESCNLCSVNYVYDTRLAVAIRWVTIRYFNAD